MQALMHLKIFLAFLFKSINKINSIKNKAKQLYNLNVLYTIAK
jgi:hypothetical protein